MNQIKFAFRDITANPFFFLRFLVQYSVVSVFFTLSLLQIFTGVDLNKRVDSLSDRSQLYMLTDQTKPAFFNRALEEDYDSLEKDAAEIYQLLNNAEGISFYTLYEDELTLETASQPLHLKVLNVNPLFMDTFDLSYPEDFFTQTENVLLSDDLRSFFKVGDFLNGKYTVKGFLRSGDFYIDLPKSCSVNKLKGTIIKPLSQEETDDLFMLDSLIFNGAVFCSDKDTIDQLEKKTDKLGIYDISFKPFENQLHTVLSELKRLTFLSLSLSTIFLIFSLMSVLIFITLFIEKRVKEFKVHMLCGATTNQLIIRIVFQHLPFLLFSDTLCVFIALNKDGGLLSLAFLLIMNILFIGIDFLFMKRKMKNQNLLN